MNSVPPSLLRKKLWGNVLPIIITYLCIMFGYVSVSNALITWDGGGSDNNWSTPANWVGNIVPGEFDSVWFDGTSNKPCQINISTTVASLSIVGGSTITITANQNLTVSGDVNISTGTVNLGSINLFVGGNWSVGTIAIFNSQTSTVTFNGAGVQTLMGPTTFYGLRALTSGATLQFDEGTTTYVTSMIDFDSIYLRSTTDSNTWYFTYNGSSQTVRNVDVMDSNASGGSIIYALGVSTDSGNNTNWSFETPNVWKSVVNGDWDIPGTWDRNSEPQYGAEVYIMNGTTVTVDQGTINISELLVQTGGSIKASFGSQIIYIGTSTTSQGLIDIDGTFYGEYAANWLNIYITSGTVDVEFTGSGRFNDFNIAQGATVTVKTDIEVNDLIINNGAVLDDTLGNNISVRNGWDQYRGGGYYITATSTVTFIGNTGNSVCGYSWSSDINFQNVVVDKSFGMTILFSSDTVIFGDLYVSSGNAVFSYGTPLCKWNVYIDGGNLYGPANGEMLFEKNIYYTSGSFNMSNTTCTLQGPLNQDIDISTDTAVGSLKINKTGGTVYLQSDIRIDKFDMPPGNIGTFDAGNNKIRVEGNFVNMGGIFNGNTSTLEMIDDFVDTSPHSIEMNGTSNLYDLTINRFNAGWTVNAITNLDVDNIVSVDRGAFRLGTDYQHVFSSGIVYSQGSLYIEARSTNVFTGTLEISSGTLRMEGGNTRSDVAVLAIGKYVTANKNSSVYGSSVSAVVGIQGSTYSFTLDGYIEMEDVYFINGEVFIDAATANINKFNDIEFENTNTALTFVNAFSSPQSFYDCRFNTVTTNVSYTTPGSSVTFFNAIGNSIGEAYDDDPGEDQVFWVDTINPDSITDLKAFTGRQITLEWTAPFDPPTKSSEPVAGYIVKVSSNNGGFFNDWAFHNTGTTYYQTWIPKNPGETEKYVLTGLEPGVTYYISIKTIDEDNNLSNFTSSATVNNVKSGYFVDYWVAPSTKEVVSVAWGDYDNDNDLDFVEANTTDNQIRVFRNNGGSNFSLEATLVTGANPPTDVAWGDYNNDGYIDIAVALNNGVSAPSLRIYKNNGDNTFSPIFTNTDDLRAESVCFVDTDNDGDLDVVVGGQAGKLYRNDGSDTFTALSFGSAGLFKDTAIGDFDEDGDMDIVTPSDHPASKGLYIQRNEGNNSFTEISINTDLYICAAVGDLDNDGDLDIVAGNDNLNRIEVWEKTGSSITPSNFSLSWWYSITANEIALGDYNNDGKLDIAVGNDAQNKVVILRSSGTLNYVFEQSLDGIGSSVAWGDATQDGDLDLLVGHVGGVEAVKILESMEAEKGVGPNTQPSVAPANASIYVDYANSVVKFTWDNGWDSETPTSGLYYDVRIGTQAGIGNIIPFNKESPLLGNYLRPQLAAGQFGVYLHPLIEDATYYARARTVDTGFRRSGISLSTQTYVAIPPAPVSDLTSSNNPADVENEVQLSWIAPGDDGLYGDASSYAIKYSTNQIFTWNDFNNATVALPSQHPMPPASQGLSDTTVITGLAAYTSYYFAVLAMDEVNNMGLFTTSYCFTQDISSPTISDNQADASIWLNNDPGAIYDVDFFDIGAGLDFVEYEAWTQPFQAGMNTVTNRTMTLPGLTAGDTFYKAEWDIENFNLLANGTNYISVNVFDALGYRKKYSDVFTVWKDTTLPVIENYQTGDVVWRNSNVAFYDVDFKDAGGADLEVFHVRASTNPGGINYLTIWTTVQLNIGATFYDADWSIPGSAWTAMHSDATNYISVQVVDLAGNTSSWIDAFYVLKDTVTPTIDDQQADDVVWRNSNTGVYNVDFYDTGGSMLDRFQTKVSTGPNETGILVQNWTDVVVSIDSDTYTTDWQFLAGTWNLLEPGTNYISIRVYDIAGSTDTQYDAFYVLKDTITPSYINNESGGDNTWRNTGKAYNVDFADSLSLLTGAEYTVWTATDADTGSGQELVSPTAIFTSPGTALYNADWTIDFNALKDSVTNYVSIEIYDIAANTATIYDVFYVLKDTTPAVITNNESGGDATWMNAGRAYNVDFKDLGSELLNARYSANTLTLKSGTTTVALTDIPGFVTGSMFTTDWALDFNSLLDGSTNYISLEVYDVAGNTRTLTDAFYILKDTTTPTYITTEAGGDNTWRNIGRAYDVNFDDPDSELSGAAYTAWTQTGRTGLEKVALTAIPGVSGPNFATDWTIDFASLQDEVTNYISIEIYDVAGSTRTVDDLFYVKKDITPPVSTTTVPSGTYQNYVDTISGTSLDTGSDLNEVRIRIYDNTDARYWDGTSWVVTSTWVVTSGTLNWGYSILDSTFMSNHNYDINSRAEDNATNLEINYSTYTFIYDRVDPTSLIQYPAETYVSYLDLISGTADDNIVGGVDFVEIEIKRDDNWYWNGTGWQFPSAAQLLANLSGNDWDVSVDSNAWANTRDYEIRVLVNDKAGNLQSSTTHQFTFDTSDPTVQITYPSSARHSQLPTISGTSADGAFGNVEDVSIRVYSFTDNAYWDGSGFTIAPAGKDTAWYITDTSDGYDNWSSTFSAWNTSWQYQVEARVKDTAGQYGVNYSTGVFRYDTDIPESYIDYPVDGSFINALSAITGTAADTGTNAGSVVDTRIDIRRNTDNLWFDGSDFTQGSLQYKIPGGTPAAWSYTNLTTGLLDNGTSYLIVTRAQDDAVPANIETPFNVRNATFTFDNGIPSSAIQYPVNNDYLSDILLLTTISGTLSDDFAGVSNVYLKVYEKGFNNYYNGSGFSSTVSTVSVTLFTSSWTYSNSNLYNNMQQATYLIYTYAEDNAGNIEALEPATTIYYDTTLPTSDVVYPVDTAYISSTPTITGTADDSDSGMKDVEVSLRLDETPTGSTGGAEDFAWTGSSWTAWTGDMWQTASGINPWNYTIAASSWVFGKNYWIKSRADDNADNVETAIGNGNRFRLTLPADSYGISINTNLTAGLADDITVEVIDINSDRALTYTGTVQFTVASGPETAGNGLPGDYTFAGSDEGYKVFTNGVTLRKAGDARTITVTDTIAPAITATSSAIKVSSEAVSSLLVLLPGETIDPGTSTGKLGTPTAYTAGTNFAITVHATDDYYNIDTSTDASYTMTTTDFYDGTPSIGSFINGTHMPVHTFYTASTHTVTVAGSLSGTTTDYTSAEITISSDTPSKLLLVLPGQTADPGNSGSATGLTGTTDDQVAGVSFDGTVRLVDDYWNLSDGDTPDVYVTTTDLYDTHPATATLSSGEKVFTFTCITNSSITLLAQDVNPGAYTQYSSTWVWVAPDVASDLQILVPGETAVPGSGKVNNPLTQTAGAAFYVTVNGVDANWNIVPSAGYLIQLNSSDSYDAEPLDQNLVSGTTYFTITLITAGNTTITATTGGWNDTSPALTVDPNSATGLQLLLPNQTAVPGDVTNLGRSGSITSQVSGSTFTVTVSAVDDYYNVQTSSTPAVQIVTDDPFYSGPASAALVAGTLEFDLTFVSEGTFNVTVSTTSGDYLIEDSTGVTITDGLAPAAITDLTAQTATTDVERIDLTWTAPGDDGTNGTASYYELRYATYTFNDAQFSSIAGLRIIAVSVSAHNQETYMVTGLLKQGTTYYFAIKTYDDGSQASAIDTLTAGASQAAARSSIKTWTGATDTDWLTATNWTPYGVPTSTHPVDIPNVTNDPVISSPASLYNCLILSGGNLTVNANLDAGDTDEYDVLETEAGATLTVNNSTVTLQGGFLNNGTFNATNSLLKFNGSGNQRLNSTAADSIYLVNGTLYLDAQPIITGDFIMASGTTLEMLNETIFMDGSWLNYGGTVNTSGASQLAFTGGTNEVFLGPHGGGSLILYMSKGSANLTVTGTTSLDFQSISINTGNLVLNNGVSHSVATDIIVYSNGSLTVDGASTRLSVGGDVDIRSNAMVTLSNSGELDITGSLLVGDGITSGDFNMLSGSILKVDTNLTVNNNATLLSNNTSNKITSSNPASVFYSFSVGVSTLNITGLILEAVDTNGLVIADSAQISGLRNITIQSFQPGATAIIINETNTATSYTFDNLVFNDGNLTTTLSAPNLTNPGSITLTNYAPADSNAKESDPNGVITWVAETYPPDPIVDLNVTTSGSNHGAIQLQFTAIADNPVGNASVYYVKYSSLNVTDAQFSGDTTAWWNAATDMTGEPAPAVATAPESFEISGLPVWTTYYFAIKAEDASGNISDFSNSGATPGALPAELNAPTATTGFTDTSSNSRLATISGTSYDDATVPVSGVDKVYVRMEDTVTFGTTDYTASGTAPWTLGISTGVWVENRTYNVYTKAVDNAGNDPGFGSVSFSYEYDATAPAAITDFSASAAGVPNTLNLQFTVPEEDNTSTSDYIDYFRVGYQVGVDFTSTTFSSVSQRIISNTNNWPAGYSGTLSVTGLTDDVTYYFHIKSVDKAGNVSAMDTTTNVWAVPGDLTAPGAITDLILLPGSTIDAVSLSWTVPYEDGSSGSAPTSYTVAYGTKAILESTFSSFSQWIVSNGAATPGSSLSVEITGLINGLEYYFRIRSTDDMGNVSSLNTGIDASIDVGDTTKPKAISDLRISLGSTSDTVDLTWTVPYEDEDDSSSGPPVSYTIAYGTIPILASNFSMVKQKSVLNGSASVGDSLSTSITGLTNGLLYYFMIRSTDNLGNVSDLNTGIDASISVGDTTAPGQITDLVASTPSSGGGEVDLTWTVPYEDSVSGNAPVSYDVRYATATFDEAGYNSLTANVYSYGNVVPGAQFTTRISNLTAGERYYFRITSIDDAGNVSSVGYSANALASYTTSTDITGKVTQSDGTGITGAVITISKNGTAVTAATTFDGVYRATGLTAGETYRVEVSWTVNGITSSVYIDSVAAGSGDVDFTLEIQYVLANITGRVIGARMVARRRVPGVYRAPGGGGESFIELIQNNIVVVKVYTDLNGNYRIPNLLPGEYIARAFNGVAYSLPKTISVGEGENISLSFQFILLKEKDVYNFPNPCRKETTIRFLTNAVNIEVQVQIFTITGELVREIKGNELTLIGSNEYQFAWDLTNMYGENVASGVYIYVVKVKDMTNNERASVTKKLAIIR